MLVDWVGLYVLVGFARQFNPLALPKAGYRIGLTSLLLLAGAGSVHDATALNETRTLSFHHTHSDEDLTVTFKRDGRYDEEALKKLNHFLRDWRSQDQTTMDRHLFDILWEVYRDVDGKKPIQIISAYRSPATNAMLRRRSSGVARFSQHMLGHAMDFYIPDVPLEQIRYAGLRVQRGGVGFYPTSGSPFVHLDTGNIRHWPRMTHDQLARVFPDGRTVHVPSDGTPLKGYELARADIERRGPGDDAATVSKPPGLLAPSVPGGKSNDDEDEGASAPVTGREARLGWPSADRAAKSAESGADAARRSRVALRPSSWPRPTRRSCRRPKRKPDAQAAADTGCRRAETADAGRYHQCPRLLGRRADDGQPGHPRAGRSPAARARRVAAADPQSTASVSEAFNKALAYAPAASSPVDRANIVAATAPIPQRPSVRRAMPRAAATEINTVVAKGRAGSGQRGRDLDAARRCQGQRYLDARRDAGAEREQRDVDDRARRHRHDPDAQPFRQAAGHDRDDLLGRSDDGHDHATASPDRRPRSSPTQSFVMRTAALR